MTPLQWVMALIAALMTTGSLTTKSNAPSFEPAAVAVAAPPVDVSTAFGEPAVVGASTRELCFYVCEPCWVFFNIIHFQAQGNGTIMDGPGISCDGYDCPNVVAACGGDDETLGPALTGDDYRRLIALAARGSPRELMQFVSAHRRIRLNTDRRSLQVADCAGTIAANIPLSAAQVASLSQ